MTANEAHTKLVRLAGQAGEPAGKVIVSRQQYAFISKTATNDTVFTKLRMGVQHVTQMPLWGASRLLCDCMLEVVRC